MGAGHDHGTSEIQHEKPLWWAFGLTAAFLIAEVVGGLLTNSLALLSDAAHMMTDVIALAISLFAVRLARKPPDAKRTYGYARLEAIGAMINGGLLFVVAGYILWEAIGRFRNPPSVASTGMLVIAVLGLVINLISMRLLKAGSGTSLNVKGAYLEVWSDMLGSVGVLIGALVIRYTGWTIADPIIAVLIGLWVLPRTWRLLRAAMQILMQGVPVGLDLEQVRALLVSHPGVSEVHDLHAWSLGSKEPVLTAHIVVGDAMSDPEQVRVALAAALDEKFGIGHATLQVERTPCDKDHGHA
ncbi:cation diffusion facilitator family transporter [Lysobacter sp. 2RAF19]